MEDLAAGTTRIKDSTGTYVQMTLAYKSALTYVRRMKYVVGMKYHVIIHCIFAAPKKIRTSYEVRMKYHVIIHCIFAAPTKILLLFPKYDLADHLRRRVQWGSTIRVNELYN